MSDAKHFTSADEAERRRRVRRSAIVFGLIAAGFYLAFIVMSVIRATS